MKLNENTNNLFWKIIAWLAILILTAIVTAGSQVYTGARDGTKALKQTEQHEFRIDSLCRRSDLNHTRLTRIEEDYYKFLNDQNNKYEKLYDRIDDIYKILIKK